MKFTLQLTIAIINVNKKCFHVLIKVWFSYYFQLARLTSEPSCGIRLHTNSRTVEQDITLNMTLFVLLCVLLKYILLNTCKV